MSMYNMMFGHYPAAAVLRAMLDLEPEGRWPVGRFRDIYPEQHDGSLYIVLYTRNGGGNRNCWTQDSPADRTPVSLGESGEFACSCPGCTVETIIKKHPLYVTDWDDDFDCTYAYVRFRIPDRFQEEVRMLLDIGGKREPQKMFFEMLEKLKSGKSDDPEVRAAVSRLKPLIDKLAAAVKNSNGSSIIEV